MTAFGEANLVMTQRRLRSRKVLWFPTRKGNHDRITPTSDLPKISQPQISRSHLTGWLVIGGIFFTSSQSAIAQLRPIADETLGKEQTIVQVFNGLPLSLINGGARRGANLFHSFREFSIGDRQFVFFANPVGVTNILARVTGSNPSQILGSLRVLGDANLFLINPNGILFGPNAQLSIRGSFLASTANSLVFNNGFAFSSISPQAPPLLTVNVPIGLQYGSNPRAIQVQGVGLQVPDGQTLTLAGGPVTIDNAGLFAYGGRVELASVASPGEVGLAQQGQELRLSVPAGLNRADVTIVNDSIVDVSSGESGNIAITAHNLVLKGFGTKIQAGISADAKTVDAQAGDININTTETVSIDESLVTNEVQPGSIGRGGNIRISTDRLSLLDGAQVSTPTTGPGNAGSITITANDSVLIDGMTSDKLFSSGVISTVSDSGQGGDISISTGRLSLTGGALIDTTTVGKGNAGKITITARDEMFVEGVGNRFPGGVISRTESTVGGQGGDISITTGNLFLTKGGAVSVTTFGPGAAGNITIAAANIASFDGVSSNGLSSGAFSSVETGARGQGGEISITASKFYLTNGAVVNTPTFGTGDAGKVTITARDLVSFRGVGSNQSPSGVSSSVGEGGIGQGGDIRVVTGILSLTNGAKLTTSTFDKGEGRAGNIIIMARDAVFFDGASSNGLISGAFSSVRPGGIGQGGNIHITTGTLSLTNGAAVNAATAGKGDAGNITIAARDRVSFEGGGSIGSPSGVFSAVSSRGIGQGGDISITTGVLSLARGALVSAATVGNGNAGNITITARDTVSFNGAESDGFSTGAFSTVESGAKGNGGRINVNTELFSIMNGAELSASSVGEGRAGDLEVNARQLRVDNQGSIAAQTASGQGGNIKLQIGDLLLLRRGSSISTNAGTAEAGGDGGNITFNGKFIVTVPNENSDITANAFTGRGGRVDITAQGIFGTQFRPQTTPFNDITASSTFGISGVVSINTPNIDPNRGLVQLPGDLVDASRQIANTCSPNSTVARGESRFTVTGRGGLPSSPDDTQTRYLELDDLGPEVISSQVFTNPNSVSSENPATEIVEAQGWMTDSTGNLFLVARSPQVTPHNSVLPRVDCRP